MEIRKISRRRPRSVDDTELGPFHVLVLQRTAKKCTKIYNARAQLLFCSLRWLTTVYKGSEVYAINKRKLNVFLHQ